MDYNYYLLQQFSAYRHLHMRSLTYLIPYGISQMIRMALDLDFLDSHDALRRRRYFQQNTPPILNITFYLANFPFHQLHNHSIFLFHIHYQKRKSLDLDISCIAIYPVLFLGKNHKYQPIGNSRYLYRQISYQGFLLIFFNKFNRISIDANFSIAVPHTMFISTQSMSHIFIIS